VATIFKVQNKGPEGSTLIFGYPNVFFRYVRIGGTRWKSQNGQNKSPVLSVQAGSRCIEEMGDYFGGNYAMIMYSVITDNFNKNSPTLLGPITV